MENQDNKIEEVEVDVEVVEEEVVQPKKLGRPRKYQEGEIVKYIQKPRPGYHRQYYHNSKLSEKLKCELCDKLITCQKMARHQISRNCKKVYCMNVLEV